MHYFPQYVTNKMAVTAIALHSGQKETNPVFKIALTLLLT